jgi:hypothetical protein
VGGSEKEKWIKRARLAFRPSRRQNCYVCGKFGSITQAHHTVPLAVQFDHGFKNAADQHAWLCPNHHAILHVLIDPLKDDWSLGRRASRVIDDLSAKEWKIMVELMKLAEPDEREK